MFVFCPVVCRYGYSSGPVKIPDFRRFLDSCLRVVSRLIIKLFERRFVFQASEPGSVVAVYKIMDEGIALVMGREVVFPGIGAIGGRLGEGFPEASVEAFHHAIGLRPVWPCELVFDPVGGADLVKGVPAGSLAPGSPVGAAKSVGKLRPVIGENGMNGVTEGFEEALETGRDGVGAAIVDDLDMDKPGAALQGDKDVSRSPVDPGQMLEINVDIAERRRFEALRWVFRNRRFARHPVSLQQPVQARARDVVANSAAHHLENVIQGEAKPGAQFEGDLFLHPIKARLQIFGTMGAILNTVPLFPAPDRALGDAIFRRKRRHRRMARLDCGADLRCRRRIRMEMYLHHFRSLNQDRPIRTPMLSIQSTGTQHGGRSDAVGRYYNNRVGW